MTTLPSLVVIGLSGLFGFLMLTPILLTELRTAFSEENRIASRLYYYAVSVNLLALLVLAFFGTKLFPESTLDAFTLINLITMVVGVIASFTLLIIMQHYIKHLYFTHEVENWLLYTVTLCATTLGWNLSFLF